MKIEISNCENKQTIYNFVSHACQMLEISPQSIEIDDCDIDGVNGMCIDLSEKDFLILVKSHKNMLRTLAHELVHVKQYMKQNLGHFLGTEEYETSWWEVEARTLSNLILEKFNECNDSKE